MINPLYDFTQRDQVSGVKKTTWNITNADISNRLKTIQSDYHSSALASSVLKKLYTDMGAQYDELRMELNTMLTSNRRVANPNNLTATLADIVSRSHGYVWFWGRAADDGLGGSGVSTWEVQVKEDGQNEASRSLSLPYDQPWLNCAGSYTSFPGFNGSPALSVSASMRLRAMDNAGNAGEWSDWRG